MNKNISVQTNETESQPASPQIQNRNCYPQFNDYEQYNRSPSFYDHWTPINFKKKNQEEDLPNNINQVVEEDNNSPLYLSNQQIQSLTPPQPPQKDQREPQTFQQQFPSNQQKVVNERKLKKSNKKKLEKQEKNQQKQKREVKQQQAQTSGNRQNINDNCVLFDDALSSLYYLKEKTTQTKKYKKQVKQQEKNQKQDPEDKSENQHDKLQQFKTSKKQQSSKRPKIYDKHIKVQNRIDLIVPSENEKCYRHEVEIQEYFRKQNYIQLPEIINKRTISQILQISLQIKSLMVERLEQMNFKTQEGQIGYYILQMIMLNVKYNFYVKINPNNYKLEDSTDIEGYQNIQWFYKMRDDLRDAFKKPKVQDAIEFIYRFVLNKEQIPQDWQKKVDWEKLVKDTKREFLGYQQEIGRNHWKSNSRNYYRYIEKNPKLKENSEIIDEIWYNEGKQNAYTKKRKIHEALVSKLKNYIIKEYLPLYLNNHNNEEDKIIEIRIDDLLNLIAFLDQLIQQIDEPSHYDHQQMDDISQQVHQQMDEHYLNFGPPLKRYDSFEQEVNDIELCEEF